jgi:hypothetical protein
MDKKLKRYKGIIIYSEEFQLIEILHEWMPFIGVTNTLYYYEFCGREPEICLSSGK